MCIPLFRRICHWGPLTALGIIKLVTAMTIHCLNMWWSKDTITGKINFIVFITFSGLTLYNFLSSMYHGPGYLEFNWKPNKEGDCRFLQMCGVCQGYKAPRAHHCRKCGRCVLKMDHHCPWINNCVGWGNHAHFTLFLLFATLGCGQAAWLLGWSLYRSIYVRSATPYQLYTEGQQFQMQPAIYLGVYGLILCVFALGFSIGVVIAVGMLLYLQLRAILRNRTGIEDWILEKANFRRVNTNEVFVFPYDLGWRENFFQVMNWSCQPVGDGIHWPVRKDCDQYTLTREQLMQKNEKRLKTRTYTVIKEASGYWFPIIDHGIKVCLNFPCTDEPRIVLKVGDTVMVTRWRKHWLFGELVQRDMPEGMESLQRVRGWFPRRCAVETVDGGRSSHSTGSSSRNSTVTVQQKKRN